MTKKVNLKKILTIILVTYLIVMSGFYMIAADKINYTSERNSVWFDVADVDTGDIIKGTTIEQSFIVGHDIVTDISIKSNTRNRVNKGNLNLTIKDKKSKEIILDKTISLDLFKDNQYTNVLYPNTIDNMKGKEVVLELTTDVQESKNAIGFWKSNNIEQNNMNYYINGSNSKGTLNIAINGLTKLAIGSYYWEIVVLGGVIIFILGYVQISLDRKGKKSRLIIALNEIYKYKFLLNQLIARDFKTKYKRSVLGILWSFLNPLLTMSVQYIIFSTIFKSDIPNFQVYLLSGVILFNFFSEATGLGINSIIGNASLINKVYVPKYIYPVSRVFSSVINLVLSLIPLTLVIILSKVPIKESYILIIFSLVCTILFTIGVVLVLSSMMVFFRDTQFIWSVIIMLWMYATPIFYPEYIISEKFSFILKFNPMNHFIQFTRTCILQGVSPELTQYLSCAISALVMLLVGAFVFKKTQDKFILNL